MNIISERGIGKQVALNTVFNYLKLFVQIITSLFLTRIIYFNLGSENYGFWQLLWMVFGYALLLDFGFGISMQKYAAEYTVSKDVHKLNAQLSSVIVTYILIALVIIVLTLCTTPFIDDIFILNKGGESFDLSYYKLVFAVFGIGAGIAFPFGVFAEIVHGLGRNDLRSVCSIGVTLVNYLGIYLVFEYGWSLLTLTVFSLSLNIFVSFIYLFITYKAIPGLCISFRLFSFEQIRSVASFSIFAYMTMFSKRVIFKTDQILLGIMLGMPSVAIYHISSRLSMLMSNLSTRFQENLAPVAAALYKTGDMEKLRWILLKSNRLAVFITTGVFITFFMLHKPILYFWLEITDSDKGAYSIAMIMLVSIFILTLFRSASDRFMFMANQHKYLAGVSVVEAALNIICSITFIRIWGIVGVAWGTFVPNTFVSLFIFFPLMCKFSGFSKRYFIVKVYLPVFLVALPSCAVMWWMTHQIFPITDLTQWAGKLGFLKLSMCSGIGGFVYILLGWKFILRSDEKTKIVSKVITTFGKGRAGV